MTAEDAEILARAAAVVKSAQRAISRTCQQQLRAQRRKHGRCIACDRKKSEVDAKFARCQGCREDHAARERKRRSQVLRKTA